MSDLSEIRASAAKAQQEYEARTTWFTTTELAERWGLGYSTVRDVPAEDLPYLEFGSGLKNRRRRYAPSDVAEYERTHRKGLTTKPRRDWSSAA